MPKFAATTFKEWFRQTRNAQQGQARSDSLGRHVQQLLPSARGSGGDRGVWRTPGSASSCRARALCCGRPLYDYGFLDDADKLLGDILTHLKPSIEAGTPVVGLEPSCLAVFRDEMLDLRPARSGCQATPRPGLHAGASSLRDRTTNRPLLNRDIVVHGHCHQKAIISLDAEKKLFEAMGAKAEILDDGCCGMAGSFGFEQHKYDLSMQIYEHKLGPRLARNARTKGLLSPTASVARPRSNRRPAGVRSIWRKLLQIANTAIRPSIVATTGSKPKLRLTIPS